MFPLCVALRSNMPVLLRDNLFLLAASQALLSLHLPPASNLQTTCQTAHCHVILLLLC